MVDTTQLMGTRRSAGDDQSWHSSTADRQGEGSRVAWWEVRERRGGWWADHDTQLLHGDGTWVCPRGASWPGARGPRVISWENVGRCVVYDVWWWAVVWWFWVTTMTNYLITASNVNPPRRWQSTVTNVWVQQSPVAISHQKDIRKCQQFAWFMAIW